MNSILVLFCGFTQSQWEEKHIIYPIKYQIRLTIVNIIQCLFSFCCASQEILTMGSQIIFFITVLSRSFAETWRLFHPRLKDIDIDENHEFPDPWKMLLPFGMLPQNPLWWPPHPGLGLIEEKYRRPCFRCHLAEAEIHKNIMILPQFILQFSTATRQIQLQESREWQKVSSFVEQTQPPKKEQKLLF